MNKLSHGSSRHSTHQRSFALNIPTTSEFRLGDPSRKTETDAASPAGATIIGNHLRHIVSKQQVTRETGGQSVADLNNPDLPGRDRFERERISHDHITERGCVFVARATIGINNSHG